MINKEYFKIRKSFLMFEQEIENEIRSDIEKNIVNNMFKTFD